MIRPRSDWVPQLDNEGRTVDTRPDDAAMERAGYRDAMEGRSAESSDPDYMDGWREGRRRYIVNSTDDWL